jgi:hypothetical protein
VTTTFGELTACGIQMKQASIYASGLAKQGLAIEATRQHLFVQAALFPALVVIGRAQLQIMMVSLLLPLSITSCWKA